MSAHTLEANGIGVVVRRGWEVEFRELDRQPGETPLSVVHIANFSLPAERGDYGSGAVETMDGGAILVILAEFAPESRNAALFSGAGVPTGLDVGDFSPDSLQHRFPGLSGVQRFFRVADRAFGLHVVLGAARSAPLLVPEVNRTLTGVSIR
jgi:hypothetical protein